VWIELLIIRCLRVSGQSGSDYLTSCLHLNTMYQRAIDPWVFNCTNLPLLATYIQVYLRPCIDLFYFNPSQSIGLQLEHWIVQYRKGKECKSYVREWVILQPERPAAAAAANASATIGSKSLQAFGFLKFLTQPTVPTSILNNTRTPHRVITPVCLGFRSSLLQSLVLWP